MLFESFATAQSVFLGAIFVIALIMGAIVNKTNFCTMGAVSDWVNMGDKGRLGAWLFAIAVALVGVVILENIGLVDADGAFPPYRNGQLIWAENLLGGILFGIGMTLASGCGNKALIRVGGGNLKSIMVVLIIAVIAYYMINPFPGSDQTLFTLLFYDWIRPLARALVEAEPNPGHRALATLEAQGILKAVITQNIDALHQRAGTNEVLEIHGHMRSATCIDCYRTHSTDDLVASFLSSNSIPRCPECGGVLKPDAVLFGEQLPVAVVNAAMAHIRAADLLLIAGSSLEVVPVCQLPMKVHRRGGRLIVVDLRPTLADEAADVVIHADCAEILPCIASACAR